MTITTHSISSTSNLIDETKNILSLTEGFVGYIYDDGKGVPTIGFGIALVVFDKNTTKNGDRFIF